MSAAPPFVPIERDTVQESAYQQLREALMSGQLEPGKRISIRNMAAAMNISPMPVREALRRLEAQRALVLCPGRVLAVPQMSNAEFCEVREIRMCLEGLAAERAAERASREEVDAAVRLCKEMQEAADKGDGPAYLDLNRAFHFAIYQAAGRDLLVGMIENLWLRIGPVFNVYIRNQEVFTISMAHHWQAAKAMKERDGAAAKAAIQADISEAANVLLSHLSSDDGTLAVPAPSGEHGIKT